MEIATVDHGGPKPWSNVHPAQSPLVECGVATRCCMHCEHPIAQSERSFSPSSELTPVACEDAEKPVAHWHCPANSERLEWQEPHLMLQVVVELLQTVQGLDPELACWFSSLQVVVGAHHPLIDLLPMDPAESLACPHWSKSSQIQCSTEHRHHEPHRQVGTCFGGASADS